ncbi:hypothetical protein CR513_41863, partial [Mucuna pruriens]
MSSLKEYTSFYNFRLLKRNFNYNRGWAPGRFVDRYRFISNYCWWTNRCKELLQFPPMVVEGSYYGSGEQREEFNPYE